MHPSDRREALEELVQCAGWQLFVQHVVQAWAGEGYRTKMSTAFSTNQPNEPAIVHHTADNILRLLRWPQEQLASLKKQKGAVDE